MLHQVLSNKNSNTFRCFIPAYDLNCSISENDVNNRTIPVNVNTGVSTKKICGSRRFYMLHKINSTIYKPGFGKLFSSRAAFTN